MRLPGRAGIDHQGVFQLRQKTLFQIAGLFAAFTSTSLGSVLVTNSTGFTNTVTLSALGGTFESSPFTDSNGNTATLVGFSDFLFGTSPATFTVTFAQPVTEAGLTLQAPVGATFGSFVLSNGDSTAAPPCTLQPGFTCFAGVIDATPFTSFSIAVNSNNPISAGFIEDFRYTPAAAVPEAGQLALVAPLLIGVLAALKLKKRVN